jgi:hypothetical protein
MTVTPVVPLNPRAFRGDKLVAWSLAASTVGVTSETLKSWHERWHIPAVVTPDGLWKGYQSWVDAVLGSCQPGHAPNIADITRQWWAARAATAKEVA